MKNILSIPIFAKSLENTLEEIRKYMRHPEGMCHIVSLNPELMVIAQDDVLFAKILSESSIQVCDGAGIALAGSVLGIPPIPRIPGVDFMSHLLKGLEESGLRVLFVGGKVNVAKEVTECYQKTLPMHHFVGLQGYADIENPSERESQELFSIVADHKPQFVFAAFGSPAQEKWFWAHSSLFKGVVCMGVGGAFDFVTGRIPRAPRMMRDFGLEWLYRLSIEPHRWRRQLRLIKFIYLVFLQRIGLYSFLKKNS